MVDDGRGQEDGSAQTTVWLVEGDGSEVARGCTTGREAVAVWMREIA
jgi:hypothetical protein